MRAHSWAARIGAPCESSSWLRTRTDARTHPRSFLSPTNPAPTDNQGTHAGAFVGRPYWSPVRIVLLAADPHRRSHPSSLFPEPDKPGSDRQPGHTCGRIRGPPVLEPRANLPPGSRPAPTLAPILALS